MSIDRSSFDESTNITFAPACKAASGVAMNVFVGIIIDFPLTFKALKGISNALVPLFTATANLTPINLAKSSSKWETFFDIVKWPLSKISFNPSVIYFFSLLA